MVQYAELSVPGMETSLIQKPFLVFGKPDVGQLEADAVAEVLKSGWLGYGPKCREFERRFSEFLGVKHCVAVSSCTVGLILALKASGIGTGDEVVTTPLTFAATVNAALEVGAKPVFFGHKQVPLTDRTKAMLLVHLWGSPNHFKSDFITSPVLIEDCAHAFGGSYKGRPLGTFGRFGVFSFYPTKNITTGDGGMVVCQTQEDKDKIRLLASQGLSKEAWKRYSDCPADEYAVMKPGVKGLMNDLAAVIGLVQLERWPEIRGKRDVIFKTYEAAFWKKEEGHSQHIYEIRVKNRAELRQQLYRAGIGTGIHYKPLHLEPAYKFLGYKEGDFPEEEKIGRETLSLPLSSTMTIEDAERVIREVKKYGEFA